MPARGNRNVPTASPRLKALKDSVSASDASAVPAFWREVEAAGAPLVERSSDPERRLVTFVYRGGPDLANVVLTPGIGHNADPYFNQLERLGDTDVWFRTYEVRRDLRASYLFSPNDPMRAVLDLSSDDLNAYVAERRRFWHTDPLNPNEFVLDPQQPAYSVVELPDAPPQPYWRRRERVPEGAIEREDLERDPFGAGRRIWTYLPPGYDSARGPYPLLLQFDGIGSRKLGLHTTLDNMGFEGVIPPVVCVMMHNGNRNLELPCNETFADWLADEFLFAWRTKYAITADASRIVVSGISLGGLAAAWCGLRRPDVFGNVLSQSGSYWWGIEGSGEWQWLTQQYAAAAPRLPLRFYMDVGLLEDGRSTNPAYPTMIEANRALRDVLQAKGHEVHYAEFNGGHDYVSWRGTVADGLRFLLGNAPEDR